MRLPNLLRRSRLDREMHDEIAFHIQSRADDLERTGLTRAEAERRARLEFGGLEKYKEQVRDTRRVLILDDLLRDLAYAWRSLRRTPVFTLTAAGAIAIGVAVNTGLFSLMYAAIFRPMPVKDPGTFRNVYMRAVGTSLRSTFGVLHFVSFAEFTYLRKHARTAEIAAITDTDLSCACDPDGEVRAQLVSDNLLPLIGATPAAGRFFTAAETATPRREPVAVLSFRAWLRLFDSNPDVLGRPIVMNRTAYTIIGIADERTTGPLMQPPDVWIPLTMQPITRAGEPLIDNPTHAWIRLLARRAPGTTDEAMRAELAVLGQQSLIPHNAQRTAVVTVAPPAFLNYPRVFERGTGLMLLLFTGVSLVLLIACANVANLLLARGLARRREIAIRASIGAGRRRLLQQLLTESALLGVIGGAAGLALAQIPPRLLLASIPSSDLAVHQLDLSPDWTVAAYTFAVSLVASVLFGAIPALRLSSVDLTPALRNDPGGASGAGRRIPLQNALVAIQAAVSLVLLASAGLLLRGFDRAMHMDVGLTSSHVLIASFNFRQEQYDSPRAERMLADLREAVAGWPAVTSVAVSVTEPMSSCSTSVTAIADTGTAGPPMSASCGRVGPDYFRTLQIKLLEGRDFTSRDLRDGSRVAIVDEAFARQAFASAPAVGRLLQFARSAGGEQHEIVGVVASTRDLAAGAAVLPRIYEPVAPASYLGARLLIHYRGSPSAVAHDVRSAARGIDPSLRLSVATIEERLREVLMPVRLAAAGAAALGATGLLLACTGLYGVVAFTVGRRRREIGIRVALGANRGTVMRMIVRQGTMPVVAGAAAGLVLAAGAATLLRSMLFGVSPADPVALGTTSAVLLLSAIVAAFIPARAALRIDPVATLREE